MYYKDKETLVIEKEDLLPMIFEKGQLGFRLKNKVNVNKIILPEGTEVIYDQAFSNSIFEEIYIPDTVKEIRCFAFEGCKDLKKVILPDGLEKIEKEAFCKSGLEEISIPKEIKEIAYGAFEDCENLKKITLPNGLEKIVFRAFFNTGLEEITIPETVTKIGVRALETRGTLKKIDIFSHHLEFFHFMQDITKIKSNFILNIHYKTYEKLYEDISNLQLKKIDESDKKAFEEKSNDIIINFIGPELGIYPKETIKKKLKKTLYKDVTNIYFNETIKVEKINKTYDEEINEAISEIKKIYNRITLDSKKNSIENELNNIIKEYENKIESLKPIYRSGKKQPNLVLDTPDSIKLKILDKLYTIKNNLYNEEIYIKELEKINKLNKIVKNNNKEIKPEDTDIEIKVKEILINLDRIGDKDKNNYLSKIENKLLEIQEALNKELNKKKEKELSLTTNNKDYKEELNTFIISIHEETKIKAEKLKEFKYLYNYLDNDKVPKEAVNDNTIAGLINDIKYIINSLDNNSKTEEIEGVYKRIRDKHKNRLNQILNNNSKKKYEDVENDLRKDLQELLVIISNTLYLNEYKEQNNEIDIILQLDESKKIILMLKEELHPEQYKSKIICSFVADIKKEIEENIEYLRDEVTTIKIELFEAVKRGTVIASRKKINSQKEYNETIYEILSEFADVKIKIDEYIQNLKDYNKIVKK